MNTTARRAAEHDIADVRAGRTRRRARRSPRFWALFAAFAAAAIPLGPWMPTVRETLVVTASASALSALAAIADTHLARAWAARDPHRIATYDRQITRDAAVDAAILRAHAAVDEHYATIDAITTPGPAIPTLDPTLTHPTPSPTIVTRRHPDAYLRRWSVRVIDGLIVYSRPYDGGPYALTRLRAQAKGERMLRDYLRGPGER